MIVHHASLWQLLWMELFFWINFMATLFSLIESCLVLGLAFNTEEATPAPRPALSHNVTSLLPAPPACTCSRPAR